VEGSSSVFVLWFTERRVTRVYNATKFYTTAVTECQPDDDISSSALSTDKTVWLRC